MSTRQARPTSLERSALLRGTQKNSGPTDNLRRWVQRHANAALVRALTEDCGVTVHSVYHTLEGRQRLSVDFLAAVLRHFPTVETEAAVNRFLEDSGFRLVRCEDSTATSSPRVFRPDDLAMSAN